MVIIKIRYYFRVAIQMTAVWETTTETLGPCVVCPMKKLFMAKICHILPRQELPSSYTFFGPEVTFCLSRFSKWRAFWRTVKVFLSVRSVIYVFSCIPKMLNDNLQMSLKGYQEEQFNLDTLRRQDLKTVSSVCL